MNKYCAYMPDLSVHTLIRRVNFGRFKCDYAIRGPMLYMESDMSFDDFKLLVSAEGKRQSEIMDITESMSKPESEWIRNTK